MMRRKMTIDQIREMSSIYAETKDDTLGIMALVDVENMGWCKDGVTRWYAFRDDEGVPCIYFKY